MCEITSELQIIFIFLIQIPIKIQYSYLDLLLYESNSVMLLFTVPVHKVTMFFQAYRAREAAYHAHAAPFTSCQNIVITDCCLGTIITRGVR